jgi:hypothetical protein
LRGNFVVSFFILRGEISWLKVNNAKLKKQKNLKKRKSPQRLSKYLLDLPDNVCHKPVNAG